MSVRNPESHRTARELVASPLTVSATDVDLDGRCGSALGLTWLGPSSLWLSRCLDELLAHPGSTGDWNGAHAARAH